MEPSLLTSIGTITKKEKIATVENDIRSNTLVMESLFPFPGYHGTTVPDRTDPRSLFLVTDGDFSDDSIIRAVQKVKNEYPHYFDGTPGTIELFNVTTKVVRIKYIAYEQVGELIQAFEQKGIKFQRSKKVPSFTSIIKLTKYFQINLNTDGIYNDANWKGMFYLNIPEELRWDDFEKMTISIKHNVEDKNYDAALTTMYSPQGVMDFVRIYDEQSCQGKLIFIREKYLEAIKYL
ncbi:MAG: hypothetical protein WCR58_08665 [Bacteroidales bacterium]|jgi:hypothetical protein|nr:hypothetical protein [Bacteroidales bacterium]MCK9449119.1 hypothetical protein [Bacteroidales bacterium]MDD3700269.1 hypothetical protein [Bacteroidales bacterium]MDY0368499.1 hypothetical protein [Bacteroidales bacterium]